MKMKENITKEDRKICGPVANLNKKGFGNL